ncbi:Uncharacterised protein [uncultured archaeon]|nr:Uncharacterised protein [uncultured archaeon]
MEFGVTLSWQILKNIKSWFMSGIDRDCAKYGGLTKRNFDSFPMLLGIWNETKTEGDTLKIGKKGVRYNGGYIFT